MVDSAAAVPGLVVVRGAGDIATGVIQKLVRAGFPVIALEVAHPMAIRWRAALCPAVHQGTWQVEDVLGVRVGSATEAAGLLTGSATAPPGAGDAPTAQAGSGEETGAAAYPPFIVPVLVDPGGDSLAELRPIAVLDAILAKRNCGTHRGMAPVTVALGPGFEAGSDVDFVVETMRGHFLGRVIDAGPAIANTGVPGLIAGRAHERVLHSPAAGVVTVHCSIGEIVDEGDTLCTITGGDGTAVPVKATLAGVIRGMIPDGFEVPERFKIADIDPRLEMATCCDTISDKSRAVGAAALEAVLVGLQRRGLWSLATGWSAPPAPPAAPAHPAPGS